MYTYNFLRHTTSIFTPYYLAQLAQHMLSEPEGREYTSYGYAIMRMHLTRCTETEPSRTPNATRKHPMRASFDAHQFSVSVVSAAVECNQCEV